MTFTHKMNVNSTIKDYGIHIYWDDRAGYFVAEIPEIPTCAADGATQAEALANLEETFAVLKEAYAEESRSFPYPQPDLSVSTRQVGRNIRGHKNFKAGRAGEDSRANACQQT